MRPALRLTAVGLVVVVSAITGTFVIQSATTAAPTFGEIPHASNVAITRADGLLPDGVTAFDDQYPGVTNLRPDLLAAIRQATTAATKTGVTLDVNSGWRSRAYQNALRSEAVAQFGSQKQAARWVATADTSPHVRGQAVDIGPSTADAWLSAHGAAYGLCQIYRNEPWHFELRPTAATTGCPRMYADPTQDPRMQE